MHGSRWITGLPTLVAALLLVFVPVAPARAQPAPASNVRATDHPWDNGKKVDVKWDLSPDDEEITGYKVYRQTLEWKTRVAEFVEEGYTGAEDDFDAVAEWFRGQKHSPKMDVEKRIAELKEAYDAGEGEFKFVDVVLRGNNEYTAKELQDGGTYRFRVVAFSGSDNATPAESELVTTTLEWFDGSRFALFIITLVFCGAVVYWIYHARRGGAIKVRKIAGLEAVDEAVGRATEMGRSCLYIPGTQDINDIQTIASMTVLARVARTAAEYDAKVEVPTSRSLVMTTARETIQAAYLAAGRPDAYNKDLIYYVTDEQFGYVAYLQGMMVREKPAACFYMGTFYAESLILAETGNGIGAIQVAGTAMPAQLPFFVAACDYTLIGEEFFAASAYLSGSPEELGSLKGQDVGKIVVAALLMVGVLMATAASMLGPDAGLRAMLNGAVEYLKHTILT